TERLLDRAAPPGQEGVAQDGEEPGPAIRARVEPVEAPEGAQPRVLNDVLGLRAVLRQSQRAAKERVQVHEGRRLELPDLLLTGEPADQPHPVPPRAPCPIELVARRPRSFGLIRPPSRPASRRALDRSTPHPRRASAGRAGSSPIRGARARPEDRRRAGSSRSARAAAASPAGSRAPGSAARNTRAR